MSIPLVMSAAEWRNTHGYWSVHVLHPLADWKSEIANEDTKQGYWDWAENREEQARHDGSECQEKD